MMSSLHRLRSLKLFSGAAAQRRSSMEMMNRKTSAVRRQLAVHGRQMHKFSRTIVHAKRDKSGTRFERAYKQVKRIYHRRGLKHLLLISVLVLYQFFGAALFFYLESGEKEIKEEEWRRNVSINRTRIINEIMPAVFNSTDLVKEHILYLSDADTGRVVENLTKFFEKYELLLGIKYSDQKFNWTFWNAMLYAGTVCTTIGYGHLYATTDLGRWATMIYAIFGIPLVLSILDDIGRLLTWTLKYPWVVVKMACRRLSRHCTNMTKDDIHRLDAQDKQALEIFDLPIPVALAVAIAWIFFSSATLRLSESWDYFTCFYFFFISLTTIGLGDIVPHNPTIMLLMFGYIIIGLSLVSMCINLIQAKLERSYNAGQEELDRLPPDRLPERRPSFREPGQNKVTLGVLQRLSSYSLSSKTASPKHQQQQIQTANSAKKVDKMCQTLLSIPSPSKHPHANLALLNNASTKYIPTSISFDDVMKLVDTEEGDIIVLSEFSREEAADFRADNNTHDDDNSDDDFGATAAYETVLLPQKSTYLTDPYTGQCGSGFTNGNSRVTLFQRVIDETRPPVNLNLGTNRELRRGTEIPLSFISQQRRNFLLPPESPVTSEKIIRCFSPPQDVAAASGSGFGRLELLPPGDAPTSAIPLSVESQVAPPTGAVSTVKSVARRFSRTLGLVKPSPQAISYVNPMSSDSTSSKLGQSGPGRRLSLFNLFKRKQPNTSQSLEPIEQAEYKEIDFEQPDEEDGDRTPLDPNKQSKRCKHSASS